MNKIVSRMAMLALVCLLGACSSSGPDITSTNISDSHPVVGQRVLLRVLALSDNPPLSYIWDGSGGVFQSKDNDFKAGEPVGQYYVYWVPTSASDRLLTCTVIDDEDNQETFNFSAKVKQRSLETLVDADFVLMAKDPDALIGGILAGIRNHDFTYYSATAETDFEWGKSEFAWGAIDNPLSAMILTSTTSYYYSVSYVWAVYQTSSGEWKLVSHGSSNDDVISTDFKDDGVSAVNKMGINGTRIWVATDKGLYAYSTSVEEWTNPIELVDGDATVNVTDIYTVSDRVYVATEAGIFYTTDNGDTWKKFTDTWDTKAITGSYDLVSDTIRIYALTEESDGSLTYTVRCFNKKGELLSTPGLPPDSYDWIESLDTDPLGNVWFGKWCWSPQDEMWDNPTAGLLDDSAADDNIVRSMVSPEGLVYLQSRAGKLMVWGKKKD